jgi:hypothetical protein
MTTPLLKPSSIHTGFHFPQEMYYDLDLPVEEVNISDLIHNADIPYLEKEGTDNWNLTPRELIAHFETEYTHAERTTLADLRLSLIHI